MAPLGFVIASMLVYYQWRCNNKMRNPRADINPMIINEMDMNRGFEVLDEALNISDREVLK